MAYIPQAQRSRQNGIVNQSQFGNAQNSPAMGAPAMGAPPSGNAQIQPISMAPPSPQGQQNWVTPGTFPGQNAPGTAPPPGTAPAGGNQFGGPGGAMGGIPWLGPSHPGPPDQFGGGTYPHPPPQWPPPPGSPMYSGGGPEGGGHVAPEPLVPSIGGYPNNPGAGGPHMDSGGGIHPGGRPVGPEGG